MQKSRLWLPGLAAVVLLAGCAGGIPVDSRWAAAQADKAGAGAGAEVAATVAPAAKPAATPIPVAGAATAEALDVVSDAERAAATAATAAPVSAEARLGATVASLGNPTEAGFWIKTPLVKAEGKGKLVNPASGKAVNVTLIPLSGAASAGSQVSLSAMRELGVKLTDLPEIEVWRL